MKKTKILVPAIAVLALGIAASTTATVAWFQAAGATLEDQIFGTANVSAVSSVQTEDTFTITASAQIAGSVRLTDASGNTYVWDGHQNLPVSDSGTAMQQATVTFEIEYTGDGSYSPSQLSTLWDTLVDSKGTFKFTCEDATDYTSTTVPTDGNAPSAIAAAAGTTKKYGLKFAANSTTYNTGYVLNGVVSSVDVSFAKAEIKGLSFSSNTATVQLTTKAYVGVWGIDSFEQKTGDSYVAKFTPAIS